MSHMRATFEDIFLVSDERFIPVEVNLTSIALAICPVNDLDDKFDILTEEIDFIEKSNLNEYYSILITRKDLLFYHLRVPIQNDRLYELLNKSVNNASNGSLNESMLIALNSEGNLTPADMEGWNLFDLETEMQRIVEGTPLLRISNINEDFKVCSLYPKLVIVPAKMDDSVISRISKFRYDSCFPVCVYVHREARSMLIRSSQPLNLKKRQFMEEVTYLNSFTRTNKNWIVDLRSPSEIRSHEQAGGGKELQEYCPFWKIHVVSMEKSSRLSSKFYDIVRSYADSSRPFPRASSWLSSVSFVIEVAAQISKKIQKETMAVLIHGKSSSSRSVLISSLVMIMVDPEFRTYRGFHGLIFREWLWGAFNFSNRTKFVIFVIFLDSVWQMMQQFPTLFEFSKDFLILLFCHGRSSTFGTFFGASEKQRTQFELAKRTKSLWSYTVGNEDKYSNSMYKPCDLLVDSISLQDLKIWTELYGRGHKLPKSSVLGDLVGMRIERVTRLEKKVESLKLIEEILLKEYK